jgi:DNA-binding response OmpR family regulator
MHIFHLEDDNMLRELLQVALVAVSPNLKLEQVITSDEAVSYIKQNSDNIDLFVLDIRVPGELDGIQVAEFIRSLGATSPIIITSAYRRPNAEMMEKHKLQWMSKPWHILQVPEQLLQRARK